MSRVLLEKLNDVPAKGENTKQDTSQKSVLHASYSSRSLLMKGEASKGAGVISTLRRPKNATVSKTNARVETSQISPIIRRPSIEKKSACATNPEKPLPEKAAAKDTQKKKSTKCLWICCIILAISLVLVGGGGFAGWKFYLKPLLDARRSSTSTTTAIVRAKRNVLKSNDFTAEIVAETNAICQQQYGTCAFANSIQLRNQVWAFSTCNVIDCRSAKVDVGEQEGRMMFRSHPGFDPVNQTVPNGAPCRLMSSIPGRCMQGKCRSPGHTSPLLVTDKRGGFTRDDLTCLNISRSLQSRVQATSCVGKAGNCSAFTLHWRSCHVTNEQLLPCHGVPAFLTPCGTCQKPPPTRSAALLSTCGAKLWARCVRPGGEAEGRCFSGRCLPVRWSEEQS